MKRILLLPFLLFTAISFSQIVDQFTYTGALSSNGWTMHSGTLGQFQSDNVSSLTYPGLAASAGFKASYVSGNGEDINKAISISSDSAYYSMILNVPNTTGLAANTSANGDNFFGFGQTAGATLTVFGGQLRIRSGSVAGTYNLAIVNSGAGSLTPVFTADMPVNVPIFVVVKVKKTTSPVQATLWINPTPGTPTEATPTLTSTLGATPFTTFASLYMRQAATTGNTQIDEIRVGSSWTSVTPGAVASCNTTHSFSVSICEEYTVPSGDETYTVSGTYMDTIPNAALCDSVMTINVTILNPTTSTINPSACTSYTPPSGSPVYTVSGTYTDVIPNAAGCDSTITINLSIVASITYYADADGDGLGNLSVTTSACSPPVGYVSNSTDCDDSNNLIGAATVWYLDSDTDSYGDGSSTTTSCIQPLGYVSSSTDCDDSNPNVHPGGTEIANNGIDEDCSGGDLVIAPATLAQYTFTGHSCPTPVLGVTAQPANAVFSDYSVNGASLACATGNDFINYSGWSTSSVVDPTQYYGFNIQPDACYGLSLTQLLFTHRVSNSGGTPTVHLRSSLDGFAADIATITLPAPGTTYNETVNLPSQFLSVYDNLEFRFYITSIAATGATYRNDNVSVVGLTNSLSVQTYYADVDGDGFGDAATSITNCVPPVGYVADNTDCNDNNEDEYPGATWAIDNDGDGYVGATILTSCTQPVGYITSSAPTDCDDNNNAVFGQTTYYADADGDTYGDLANSTTACSQPIGYVTNNTDCDDTDNSVGAASIQYFFDTDGDAYGDPNNFIFGCSIQVGYATNSLDCDDSNPSVNPDAVEVCDGLDNNCNNDIDEGVPTFTFYQDADGDGLGNPNVSVDDCNTPVGYVGNDNDCDDTDSDPNAGETVYYMDADSDGFGDDFNSISTCTPPVGYTATAGDCNDADDQINPDATDTEGNSIDENCDGVDGNLGIDANLLANLTVHPNPGTSSVQVSFSGSFENTTLSFLTVDGKTVNVGTIETTSTGITASTANLIPGVYFIKVAQGNTVKTIRWVKQ